MSAVTAPAATSEALTEIIHGIEVKLPPRSWYAARVGFRLARRLGNYAEEHQLGEVDVETLFPIPSPDDPGRERRPDVAFTSYTRWPREQRLPLRDRAADVVPNLVVEVVSPTDNYTDLDEKVLEYFAAGVDRVWVIDPISRRAVDHLSPDEIRMIREGGSLDGGTVLPGFQLTLSDLFDPPA